MLNCAVETFPVKNLPDNVLSVGRIFFLSCEGNVPTEFQLAKANLNIKEPLQLKLLSAQMRSPAHIDLKVVSYQVGVHELKEIQLSDGILSLPLNISQFEVKSVIKQNEPPPQAPFGPYGPFTLQLSILFWLLIAALILALTTGLVSFILKRRELKTRLVKVKEYDYALNPKDQFFRDMRTLKRAYFTKSEANMKLANDSLVQAFELVEKSFFVLLTREFLALPFEWSSAKTFKFIKRNKRLSSKSVLELKIILNEVEKLRSLRSKKEIESYDLKNLLYRMENWAEELSHEL